VQARLGGEPCLGTMDYPTVSMCPFPQTQNGVSNENKNCTCAGLVGVHPRGFFAGRFSRSNEQLATYPNKRGGQVRERLFRYLSGRNHTLRFIACYLAGPVANYGQAQNPPLEGLAALGHSGAAGWTGCKGSPSATAVSPQTDHMPMSQAVVRSCSRTRHIP